MRVLFLISALLISGCSSHEYSQMPEPIGEWVPANPPAQTPTPTFNRSFSY